MLLKLENLNDKTYQSHTTYFGMKLLKGKYIDEWISFKGLSRSYSNITIHNNNIKLFYSSFSESGQIFERTNEVPYCSGEFDITFNVKKIDDLTPEEKVKYNFNTNLNANHYSIYYFGSLSNNENKREEFIDKLVGTFNSTCGVSIKFELEYTDDSDTYKKVSLYSVVLTLFIAIQILNNVHLTNKIGESNTLSNSVI